LIAESQLTEMIKEAKSGKKKRKFKESLEMIMVFRDIDVKKGFALNETIQLPKALGKPASICVMASGDLSLKAKSAKADKVIDESALNQMATNKRESRKFINNYDFFLAETKLMPIVGKALGQLLGPRGKMPTPLPFNAPIESILQRFRSSVRIRVRNSLSLSCKIGDESMGDNELAANAHTIVNTVEKKLPNGEKNIRKIMVKTTMGNIINTPKMDKEKNAQK